MAKEPEKRYADPGELKKDLNNLLEADSSSIKRKIEPPSPKHPGSFFPMARKLLRLAAAALVVIILAYLLVVGLKIFQPSQAGDQTKKTVSSKTKSKIVQPIRVKETQAPQQGQTNPSIETIKNVEEDNSQRYLKAIDVNRQGYWEIKLSNGHIMVYIPPGGLFNKPESEKKWDRLKYFLIIFW